MTVSKVVVSKNNFGKVISSISANQITPLKEQIGARLEKAFKEGIKTGDSSWAPLSPSWIEQKGHANPWYYTGRLEKAIEYEVNDDGVHVGILKHESYPDGETVASVAAQMEYGASKIPARPLFAPVFEEQVDDIIKDAAADIKKRVKEAAL